MLIKKHVVEEHEKKRMPLANTIWKRARRKNIYHGDY